MSRNLLVGAGLLTLAQLNPVLAASALVSHESLAALPSGWSQVGTPAADTNIQLSVGLTLENIEQLESHLQSVSTPGSASYGQYLDSDDIAAQYGPSDASVEAVTNWLNEAGITEVYNNGQSIHFGTTVSKANSLLGADFNYYSDGGSTKLRTLAYSVPSDLKAAIDLVSPTTYFGKTTASRSIQTYKNKRASTTTTSSSSSVSVAASCQTSITPACLKQIYNVGNYTPRVASGSRVGFGSFLNQSAIFDDLFTYEKVNGIPSQNFTKVIIANAPNDQNPNDGNYGEANLDVQNIVGISHPLPKNDDLPQVISNSYGDDEQSVPYKYAVRACNLIGLTGLRGITVLESSGDLGVGAGCLSNDGKNKTQFDAIFPATCPYLTAVGGTQAVTPEIAWTASSGGFSYYFPRAWYQEGAIETYLGLLDDSTKEYYSQYTNFEGRGFPDVAAHSLLPDYQVVGGGELQPSGGTSAASPVFAGIIALLNDARLSAGKPTLGFLNPFIYFSGYRGLNDITGGQSVGCNGINGQTGQPVVGGGVVPGAAWNCTTGWDPATGLGTPDFQKLKDLVLSF
ncbi:hypothetical protein EIK77_000728 [Talaromyces pinophilus]|nr:hypothetical protein EIK77_000728 [Talaromyces pinophilus]